MELEVKQVSNSFEFFDLLFLLRKNDYYPDEFDCGWEGYLHFIITTVYSNPNFICFVLYKDKWPIGYSIVKGPDALNSEIDVIDIFIDKEHQGDDLIYLIINSMLDLCEKVGVKRVVWSSPVIPESYWKKLFDDVNIGIGTKTIMRIDFDDKYTKDGMKEKVKEIHESLQ